MRAAFAAIIVGALAGCQPSPQGDGGIRPSFRSEIPMSGIMTYELE